MPKFLKSKNIAGENVLIAVDEIIGVESSGKGSIIMLKGDGQVDVEDSFQTVKNRLATLGALIV